MRNFKHKLTGSPTRIPKTGRWAPSAFMRSYAVDQGLCVVQNLSTTKKLGGLKSRPHSFYYRSNYPVCVFCCLCWAFI